MNEPVPVGQVWTVGGPFDGCTLSMVPAPGPQVASMELSGEGLGPARYVRVSDPDGEVWVYDPR